MRAQQFEVHSLMTVGMESVTVTMGAMLRIVSARAWLRH